MIKGSIVCLFWRGHMLALATAYGILMGAIDVKAEVTTDEPADLLGDRIGSALTDVNAEDLALLAQFYLDRDMALLWVEDGVASKRAHQLVRVLKGVSYDGLAPEDYEIEAIESLMTATTPGDLAELDLRLSLGLMQMISDLGSGRTEPNELDPELFVYPRDVDKVEAMKAVADAVDIGVFVGKYRPKQAEYWRLKGVLANYRAMARVGGWPTVDQGPTMEAGQQSARVTQLRTLLLRLRDLEPAQNHAIIGGEADFFDSELAEAVKRFQRRHGLFQDGKVGPRTLQAMNMPIEERIEQIVLNLERRRWMPDQSAKRFVFVNLADFHLQLIDEGEIVFDTPVVIGSEYNKTPVFTSDMTYMVINPYWTVPPSIAKREIIPKMRRDRDYLARNGFEIFSDWSEEATLISHSAINWSTIDSERFRYKLRQRPSPSNALGQLKFIMPNDYNIYLHDTPEQADFSVTERIFSHGCVRVAEPEALADAILALNQEDWPLSRIEDQVASGDRTVIKLQTPLPVQLTYLTAWVDDDNVVHFRNDVYDRDQILADALSVENTDQGIIRADINATGSLLRDLQTVAQ